VLFVGINPGVRSAITGHHFAGFSNRFWKLLWDARLVPEPMTYADDDRLPAWGYGITNLIARPSPGIDDLRPAEYLDGWRVLERKVARLQPAIVALIGVTLYRAVVPMLDGPAPAAADARSVASAVRRKSRATVRRANGGVLGMRSPTIHGARVFVLPNPSGRNANFSYDEMLAAYRGLARAVRRLRGV
jgi:double-stranded uracil-DNA glycosylase